MLQKQRLAPPPEDHQLKTYYHWIERGVDFINLDNSSSEKLRRRPAQVVPEAVGA